MQDATVTPSGKTERSIKTNTTIFFFFLYERVMHLWPGMGEVNVLKTSSSSLGCSTVQVVREWSGRERGGEVQRGHILRRVLRTNNKKKRLCSRRTCIRDHDIDIAYFV